MRPLQLADLPVAIPIPYRSAEAPDGLDLNTLLIPNPLSTFFMRVRGHRLRRWGVHDGDLLLVDRAIEPRPGQLLVVAHGGKFLLRPLEVEGSTWQLAALGPEDAPLALDPEDLLGSGLFGVGAAVVHDMVRRGARPPAPIDSGDGVIATCPAVSLGSGADGAFGDGQSEGGRQSLSFPARS